MIKVWSCHYANVNVAFHGQCVADTNAFLYMFVPDAWLLLLAPWILHANANPIAAAYARGVV